MQRRDYYRKLRREGMRAKDAWRYAATILEGQAFLWQPGRKSYRCALLRRDGFDVMVRAVHDPEPVGSDWGEWTDDWQPGAIRNPESVDPADPEGRYRGGVYRWFVPDVSVADLRDPKLGRHESWVKARQLQRQDMQLARGGDESLVLGIEVTICRCGVDLAESSVWGIEFAVAQPEYAVLAYLTEVAEEHIAEALHEAMQKLHELCATA